MTDQPYPYHDEPAIQQNCLPTYLVIDVSSSMTPHQDALNSALRKLHHALAGSPRVSEFAHISIIAFSTQAWVVIEMTDMDYVPQMPEVRCEGATNYGDAFRRVRERINIDLPALRAQGKAVLRPAMFFLTDGVPTDRNWEKEYASLVDRTWNRRPHVITYGFGGGAERVLGRIATKAAFAAEGGTEQDEALAAALTSMLHSLVASAGAGEMQFPVEVPGYRSIPFEYID